MKICKFCGIEMSISTQSPMYYRCPICNTHVMIENVDYNYETYFIDPDKQIRIMKKDRKHYDKFNKKLDSIKKDQFDTIQSFGGGLPKLETYLNFNEIIVFDLYSKNYLTLLDDFKVIYECDISKIKWKEINISPKIIKKADIKHNDLLAFVHFLEHFDQDEFIDLLSTALSKASNILIYQPEMSLNRNLTWMHFNEQHKTLISIDMLSNWVGKRGFDVITAIKHDEDFFLYAKKKIE